MVGAATAMLNGRMDTDLYLRYLDADAARLGEVAGKDLTLPVPTCPEWTVADLVNHVATVYLHKVETIRRGTWPEPWPPEFDDADPVALLERATTTLSAELAARPAGEATLTWYDPDQTVGFWARRMALETVIHRVDGELAGGVTPAPISDDLAADGVDEVLVAFLAYASKNWPEDFGDRLTTCAGETVLVTAGERRWLARLAPSGVEITPDPPQGEADAGVSGTPHDVLLWLWRRSSGDDLRIDGDPALADRLHELLRDATQ